jgi:hypothetical protein
MALLGRRSAVYSKEGSEMKGTRQVTAALLLALLTLSTSALGDDGVNVTINNNTTRNLLVTVYDLNSSPPARVLSSATIYGFASLSILLVADASGEGHLSWTATTVGNDMRECGHRDRPGISDGETVNVFVDSDCGT